MPHPGMPHGAGPAGGMRMFPPMIPMPHTAPGMRGDDGAPNPMDSAMYRSFDSDGNGTVSPDEALTGVREQHQKYDTDGDGALSDAEFGALFAEMTKELATRPFQMLDANDDGRIDAAELAFPVQMMIHVQRMHAMSASGAPAISR